MYAYGILALFYFSSFLHLKLLIFPSECSRKVWEKRQAGQTAITLHCQENGNYEELQCEDEMCYCVDPATGNLYGSRLPEAAMNMLPCCKLQSRTSSYITAETAPAIRFPRLYFLMLSSLIRTIFKDYRHD